MRTVFVALLLVFSPVVADGQQPAAPTRTPTPSTEAQDKAIAAGIDLHDEGKYDEAIARYQDVLKENPTNMTALFELAFSYHAKKDYAKSLEAARTGAEFKSDLLPMFYNMMAETLDSSGQPEQSIEAYKRGISYAPDASVLYFNMAVTYRESLKNDGLARDALEKAALLAPTHADTQLLLGQLFQSGEYYSQAFMAIGKFLVLQPTGQSSLQAYGLWRLALRGGVDLQTPDIVKSMPEPPKKIDEGDFKALDAYLVTSFLAAMKEQENGKSELETLVAQVDGVLSRLESRDAAADRASFAGRYYVPYFAELKRRNLTEPFVYWIIQRAPIAGVREWIDAHRDRVREMLDFTQKYAWPTS